MRRTRFRNLDVVLAQKRGGAMFALGCMLNWAMQHTVPGQRRSWRARQDFASVLRAAAVLLLTIPTTFLAWMCLGADKIIGPSGIYMGGAILARKHIPLTT